MDLPGILLALDHVVSNLNKSYYRVSHKITIFQVLGVLAVATVICLVSIVSADCIQQQLDSWKSARQKNVYYV